MVKNEKKRAYRLIQYEGDPEWIKSTIAMSIVDCMDCGGGNKITVLMEKDNIPKETHRCLN